MSKSSLARWLRRSAWATAVACALSLAFIAVKVGWRMISDDDKMMSHNHKWLMPSKVMMVNQEKGIQFCFTYSPDGKLLACANSSDFLNTITIWQLPSGRERKTIELGSDVLAVHPERTCLDKSYQVSFLAFSPNGHTLP